MSFATRVKKLTKYIYSPTNPASEDAIRGEIDGSVQEVYDNVTNVLISVTDGSSGADNVGATKVGSGTAETVQEVLEELSGSDGNNVKLTGNQTVDDIKTFTSSPIVPETPIASTETSSKGYVDKSILDAMIGQLPLNSVTDNYLSDLPNQAKDNINKNTNRTLNNGKGIATNSAVIDELLVEAGISTKLAPTSGKFYDYVGASGALSQGSIDFTKGYVGTATQGTNTISISNMSVNDFSDFEIGQEVTLQDDVSKEALTILLLSDPLITFATNIVNTYPSGANVYRSNIKAVGDSFGFGGFDSQSIIDRTIPIQVVNSAYTTNPNSRPIRLSNGDIITVVSNSGALLFLKSTDDGLNWLDVTPVSGIVTGVLDWSVTQSGDNIFLSLVNTSTSLRGYIVDTNVTPFVATNTLAESQTSFDRISSVTATNDSIHVAWSSKNNSYPNSFNIRYTKSVNGGLNWDTPTQLSNNNTVGSDAKNPSISSNGTTIITVSDFKSPTNSGIQVFGTTAGSLIANLYLSGSASYIQSNPSVDALSDGTFIVAWQGSDVSSSASNIRFSKSADGGITWSAMEKLTNETTFARSYPSITRNENDNIFIMFSGYDGANHEMWLLTYATAWDTAVNPFLIGGQASPYHLNPSTVNNFREFGKPIMVYNDIFNSDVKFYGELFEVGEIDILDVDVRMNITSLLDVSDIGAYMNISDNVLSVDGKVSIVDLLADENYDELIDTRYPIDATNDEVASLLNSTVTPADKVCLKYNLTRTSTTDDVKITSILGGVY